jgi:aspartate-semialdehyde dehydrogenase
MSLKIGVVGATGALGKEIVAVLDAAPWRPEAIVPMASASCEVPFASWGGEQVAVDDLENQDWEELDAAILAVPREVGRRAGEAALRAGVPVVDCSGALAGSAPAVVPWINPEAMAAAVEGRAIAVPWAPSILLAGVLGPLRRAGLSGPWCATVLVPASIRGRNGIEELSRQVVALFNSGTPPRKVFDQGLAFDLLPQLGASDDTGWTDQERRVEAEVRALAGLDAPGSVTLVGVPVFSGISADIQVASAKRSPVDLVETILQDGGARLPRTRAPRSIPRPRKVEGQPFVHVGRLRWSDRALFAWASMDNLRVTATAAVGCCAALVRAPKEAPEELAR